MNRLDVRRDAKNVPASICLVTVCRSSIGNLSSADFCGTSEVFFGLEEEAA